MTNRSDQLTTKHIRPAHTAFHRIADKNEKFHRPIPYFQLDQGPNKRGKAFKFLIYRLNKLIFQKAHFREKI